MSKDTLVIEALRLLKDWSTGLVLVQSGIITVLGTLLKDTTNRGARVTALLGVVALIASIIAAANVVGSLPMIAMRANRIQGSIYDESGNLGIPLGINCTFEALFFVLGLALFVAFAALRETKRQ